MFNAEGASFQSLKWLDILVEHNLVTEAEQEEQLCGYCMTHNDYISAQLCGSKLRLCHCSHCIGSKPANYTYFLDVLNQTILKSSKICTVVKSGDSP